MTKRKPPPEPPHVSLARAAVISLMAVERAAEMTRDAAQACRAARAQVEEAKECKRIAYRMLDDTVRSLGSSMTAEQIARYEAMKAKRPGDKEGDF